MLTGKLLALIEAYKNNNKNGVNPGSFERKSGNLSRAYNWSTPTIMIRTGTKENSPFTPRIREQSDSTTCKSDKHRDKNSRPKSISNSINVHNQQSK
ncbi:hypothetical protein RCL_jg13709.t1 [Rhizophagus clarus]|uniref:Uncharacterized protein n=1 Tax=Rhizophagus clarus TaxID=94130 RepID=A0A8H3R7B9_9GLOM|nr:hypothetical protein RCL_jg13709.t1 [Rhizophagus clarus]